MIAIYEELSQILLPSLREFLKSSSLIETQKCKEGEERKEMRDEERQPLPQTLSTGEMTKLQSYGETPRAGIRDRCLPVGIHWEVGYNLSPFSVWDLSSNPCDWKAGILH